MKTLKYALRFLTRSKSYTVINLLGLAFSLACCIILMRYIHRELTVDTHCVDREQVYGVVINMDGNQALSRTRMRENDSSYVDERSIALRSEVTPLENDYIMYQSNRYNLQAIVTDSTYFQLFPYRVVQGSISLSAPESALLMEDFAKKLFGKENPIGKIVRFSNGKDIKIVGILAQPKNKRTLNFDLVLSSHFSGSWERMPFELIKFVSESEAEKVNQTGSHPRYVSPGTTDNRKYTFSLMPVSETYWNQSLMYLTCPTMMTSGNLSQLYILSAMCLLILFTGIINFVNLYLVSSAKRNKVYSLRKIFGANTRVLFMQIFSENFLLIASAMFLAWLIIEIMQVPIQHLLNCQFEYTSFDWLISLSLLFLLPLLVSVYAFWQCRNSILAISIRTNGTDNRSIRSRIAFLFVQYIITFTLVSLSIYFNSQLQFMLHTDNGFRTEGIIQASMIYESKDFKNYTEEVYQQQQARASEIKELIKNCPDIEYCVSAFYSILGFNYKTSFQNAKGENTQLNICYVNPGFFRLFNIPIIEGTLPDMDENARGEVIVANRSALKALGYTTCEGATVLDEQVKRYVPDAKAQPIAAVSADYYDGHIGAGIRPMIYKVNSNIGGGLYQIACQPGKVKAVLDYLKNVQKKVYGTEDFQYTLLKDEVAALYKSDRQIASVYAIFAFIGILIICLGLFGISLFDIRQRYREIAIRKVSGAGIRDLYILLLRKYVLILCAAFIVAIPLSSYFIHIYTHDFVVKAPIGIGIYMVSLLLVALISLGTLLWQIHKAANINPASIMKTE